MTLYEEVRKRLESYRSQVPEGESGLWKVERFEVSEDEAKFFNLRASISQRGMFASRGIQSGTYTKLTHNERTVMSDTPAEVSDLREWNRRATGYCFIAGLGLGDAAELALLNPGVSRVFVVEISQDVIDLVAPHLIEKYPDRLQIITKDIHKWRPWKDAHFDCVWLDIWNDICTDNLPEMRRLRNRFRKRANWIGIWAYLEHLRARRSGW